MIIKSVPMNVALPRNYALRKTANDNESIYPIAAETIRRNFYVDDCLRSDKTEQTTTKLIQDHHMVCAKGGFSLTKFVCNSRAVLKSIPVEERYKETRTLDLHRDLYCPSNVPLVSSGVWNQKSSNSVSFLTTNRQLEKEYYQLFPRFMTHLALQLLSYFQQRKYCKTFVEKTSDGTKKFQKNTGPDGEDG